MASTAALVAGWGRSQRRESALPANIPGPMSPAGNVYAGDAGGGPIGLTVEIYLGAQGWVDISSFCYYRDRVTIQQRGRPNETSTTPPQSATLTLNNRDGRFTPRNALGPYYGLIGRNTPLRISRYQNGVKRERFYGEVAAWPTTWDTSGNDVYVQITAAGMLRRFGQGTSPLQSVMRRGVPTDPLVVAYWPCEDSSGATQLAAAIGGAPMTVHGTLNAAAFSGFPASNALPTLGADSWTGPVGVGTGTSGRLSLFVDIPASTSIVDGSRIASIAMIGAISRVDLYYHATTSASLHAYDLNGNLVQDSGTVSLTILGAGYASTNRMTVNWDLSGSGGTNLSWGFLPAVGSAAGFGANLGTYTLTQLISGVSSITINPDGAVPGASVGHIWVQGTSSEAIWSGGSGIRGGIFDWVNAFKSENPVSRFIRLCAEQGISCEIANGALGADYGTVAMGAQAAATFQSDLQQCADTDLSFLYESRNQLALGLRTRVSLYNQAAKLTLDYAQHQFSAPLDPIDDDAYTRNDVTVSRINGSSAEAVQTTGTLSTQPPPAGVGTYDTSVSISLGADGSLADQAGWRLHMGTVDEPRYPRVSLNLRHPQFTGNAGLLNAALTADIGDRIAVLNPPTPRMPADALSLIVQGYSETMGIFEHDIVFTCSPESPYRIAVMDDPVLCRLDTDGSTLSAPLSAPLNSNPFFAGGSLTEWTGVSGTLTVAGTSGSATPLPSGGPTGYGVLLTPDGSLSNCALQGGSNAGSYIPAVANQTYLISALVYSPGGYGNVEIGFDWYDANQGYISTASVTVAVAAGAWTALSTAQTSAGTAQFLRPRVGEKSSPAGANTLYIANVPAWQGAVSVATATVGSPLWTTTGSDFPFDVAVGGERMTVTAVTGAASPQAFTVARCVNGVAKPQSAGTDVRLWQPMILAL